MEARDGKIQQARRTVAYYQSFDRNQSGKLEKEEFVALLLAQHEDFPSIEIRCKKQFDEDFEAAENERETDNLLALQDQELIGKELLDGELERACDLFGMPWQKLQQGIPLQQFD